MSARYVEHALAILGFWVIAGAVLLAFMEVTDRWLVRRAVAGKRLPLDRWGEG